jgi:hypothetical protein
MQISRFIAGQARIYNTYMPQIKRALSKVVHKEVSNVASMITDSARQLPSPKTLKTSINLNDFQLELIEMYRTMPAYVDRRVRGVFTALLEASNVFASAQFSDAVWALDTFLDDYLELFSSRYTYSSLNQLLQIVKGVTAETAPAEVYRRLSEWLANRATKVARDETIRLMNATNVATWRQIGVSKLRWQTTGAKNCPCCDALNGMVISIESYFIDTGQVIYAKYETKDRKGKAMALKPGRKSHPPLHRGCNCVVVPTEDVITVKDPKVIYTPNER